ncbi:hypothetical protein [Thermoanaerobacterium thermosaccharolyticum]|uniref:hypothetical protein n=1 Tax=Thermoanaerobacterium thermosaccharolyticum TaxID=1517 RepID=UPI002FD8F11E
MKKIKYMFIFIAVMCTLFVQSVYADNGWQKPYSTPPAYAGRVYTRHHYTTFEVNEGAGYKPVTYAYCPVFDVQGNFSQGYTAVDVDSTDSTGQNYQESAASYLCSILGVPQSGNYWIASPAYWKSHTLAGTVSPTAPDESSEAIYDIPVTGVQNSQGLTPRNTLNSNIVCFNNGPNGFEAGAYGYDGKAYHWYSLGTKSPIGLTADAAKNFFTTSSKNTSEADIRFSYIYGITLSGLKNSGTKYTTTVFNTTPYLAKNVHLRAYIVQNGKYTLAASTTTDIGPVARGNGNGGILQPTYIGGQPSLASDVTPVGNYISNQTLNWTFDLSNKVPSGQYQVLVTANISVDQSGNAKAEPLTTVVAYGNSLMDFLSSGLYGTKAEVASVLSRSGLNVPSGYADNYVFSGQQQGTSPGSSSGSSTNGANDLAVTDVQVTDQGNNVKDIKSTFVSSFNVGGYATIRLYDTNNGSAPHFLQSETIHLKANDTYTIDWGTIQIGSGQYSFIVSIDYSYDDNIKNWDAEQFKGDDGKNYTEQDYSNNKKSADTTGSDIPYTPPANIQTSQSAWYPPLKTIKVPVYKTVTEPVYGWKKVPYIKDQADNAKPRTRIIK